MSRSDKRGVGGYVRRRYKQVGRSGRFGNYWEAYAWEGSRTFGTSYSIARHGSRRAERLARLWLRRQLRWLRDRPGRAA